MKWVKKHLLLLTLTYGSVIIALWTLFRFFTRALTYDLIGQQNLANQWLAGNFGGSVTGATNYLLKIFLIYMPFSKTGLEPHIALIIMTIFINIATFVAVALLLKGILRLLSIRMSPFYYIGLLWFAVISGSLFWIQFANSRNLEVAGGILVVYLGLLILDKFSYKRIALLAVVASIVYFADPLQFYMTTAGFLLYTIVLLIKKKTTRQQFMWILAATIGGFVVSIALTHLASRLLVVSFVSPNSTSQSLSIFMHPVQTVIETAKANVKIFSNTSDIGRLSQIVDVLLVAVSVMTFVWLALKKLIRKKIVLFIGSQIIAIEVVYILSGQSLTGGDTSRYLIMLLIVIIIAMSLMTYVKQSWQRPLAIAVFAMIAINSLLLVGAFTFNTPTKAFPGDSHLKSITTYLHTHDMTYGYASMDTAIPSSYLYPSAKQLLPLACSNATLVKPDLFFDKKVYNSTESKKTGEIALFFDGNHIANTPQLCTETDSIKQFGTPAQIDATSDGSDVFIYDNPNHIKSLLQFSQ